MKLPFVKQSREKQFFFCFKGQECIWLINSSIAFLIKLMKEQRAIESECVHPLPIHEPSCDGNCKTID